MGVKRVMVGQNNMVLSKQKCPLLNNLRLALTLQCYIARYFVCYIETVYT